MINAGPVQGHATILKINQRITQSPAIVVTAVALLWFNASTGGVAED